MCLFPATLPLLPGQPHQSPAVLHLNDHHCRAAEATSCRQQPAFYNLPPFFQKNKQQQHLLLQESGSKRAYFSLQQHSGLLIFLYLVTIIMITIYLICLFFPPSVSWRSCSNPVLQKKHYINPRGCFEIKALLQLLLTLPQLQ